MTNPESDHALEQARGIYKSRLNELIGLGIYELIIQSGKPLQFQEETLSGLGIYSEFRGEPVVLLKVTRSKQGEEVFYSEYIELIYDGTILLIRGVRPVYTGQIPKEEEIRTEIVGKAIRDAFENPRRMVIDPRKIL